MFNKRKSCKGFTLIELLVVVLIIGILAAIALPMYEKAVERSRAAQAFTLLSSMSEAAYTYMMNNPTGEPPEKFAELSVTPPSGWTGSDEWVPADDTLSNGKWSLQLTNSMATPPGGNPYPISTVWIGRLDGKYKGAGFFRIASKDGIGRVACVERHHSDGEGIVMAGAVGDYCAKVWDANMSVFSAIDTSTGVAVHTAIIPGL